MKKTVYSTEGLILFVSCYIVAVTDFTFWRGLLERLDIFTLQGFGYLFTVFFIILFFINLLFIIFSQKYLIKPFLIFILILSVVLSYFNFQLGVVFDKEMIRNIVENLIDRNVNEALDLISLPLLFYVFVFGVIPSILILFVPLRHNNFLRALNTRVILLTCLFVIAASSLLINYRYFSFFYRQNEDLLVYVTPLYPLVAVKKYVKQQIINNYVFKELGNDAHEYKNSERKTVGVLVVGETARADHFNLNGYNRLTNPLLTGTGNLINFKNVHSCGTSTAFSVPCMFSFLNHNDYSPEKALQYSNVLDVIKKSDIDVVWEENNSSCKRVCDRVKVLNFSENSENKTKYGNHENNFDEVMLRSFDDVINNTNSDILLVLHSMGSHGPRYYNRFPGTASLFKPYCTKASPQECNEKEIINAYDNTIVYTDYFLKQIINYLEQHGKSYDSFMVYISDHGESLGEDGVYLHGLPNFLAPEAQTHIPLLIWLSDKYITDNYINMGILESLEDKEYTHDNLSHTLLGLFNVQSSVHDFELDIIYQAKPIISNTSG